MKVYYRISDNSYVKSKLPGTNKEFCLKNFCTQFSQAKIICIADNCSDGTIKMIKDNLYNRDVEIFQTKLGNAASFRYALLDACTLSDPEEIIYMVEDDYLHHSSSEKAIQEGLSRSRYVTLYDHPDKYQSEYNFGENSKVFKTPSTHWRTTVSTTMTVAARAKTFKEDMEMWLTGTSGNHPNDHYIFTDINSKNKESLAVAIPGLSYHTDLTYHEVKGIKPEVPEWIMKDMADRFCVAVGSDNALETLGSNADPLMKLIMMEVIKDAKNKASTHTS
jgi:glycosyltransferase involved in cell wall biosynthesis